MKFNQDILFFSIIYSVLYIYLIITVPWEKKFPLLFLYIGVMLFVILIRRFEDEDDKGTIDR